MAEIQGTRYLSAERAKAMHNHFKKLGFTKTERLEIAKQTLGRRIVTFTQLDENETLEVWNSARRTASARARARNELRAAGVIGQAPLVSDEEAKAILN